MASRPVSAGGPGPGARSFCRFRRKASGAGALILVATMHRDRSEAFSAYLKSLPPQQGGALLFVLWVNAIVTLAILGAQLALVVWILRRAAHSDHPIKTALNCATSPSAATVVSASALHKLARERFASRLDQGVRAA